MSKYINQVLKSGQLTSSSFDGGEFVQKLERQIRKFTKAKYCIAVNSGTSALYAALIALGIKGKVAYPSFTFRATENAIIANRLLAMPIDVRKDNLTIQTNFKDADCVIPVHLYGHIAYMDELKELNIPIIEDCCQALGSRLNNKHVGLFGDLGCFSFYPSKIISAGEGGAIITNNKKIADRLKLIRNHGSQRTWGLNLRLSEIHACIAVENFENINKELSERKKIAKYWDETLHNVTKYYPRKGEIRNNQLFTITTKNRKELQKQFPQSRIYYDYTLGHPFKNSTEFSKTVLSFPTKV